MNGVSRDLTAGSGRHTSQTRTSDQLLALSVRPNQQDQHYPAETGVEASWSAVAATGRDERFTPGNNIQSAPLHGWLLKSARTANSTWMAKQIPWAMAPARACFSRDSKPALPENPRIASIKRFHPETSSSQPKISTPVMRWRARSPLGTRSHRRGTRRITEAATAGSRLHVPQANVTAYHGLLGPKTNHNLVRNMAKNSNRSWYQTL